MTEDRPWRRAPPPPWPRGLEICLYCQTRQECQMRLRCAYQEQLAKEREGV